jgi:PEP-CTERM motif-containing protein
MKILATLVLSLVAASASADPIGSAIIGERELLSALVFDDGRFAFTGATFDPPVTNPISRCNGDPRACGPEQSLNINTYFQMFGAAFFDGQSVHVGGLMDNNDAQLWLFGSTVLPPSTQLETPWTAPLSWELVAHMPTVDAPNGQLYENRGTGLMTFFGLSLNEGNPQYPNSYRISHATVAFDAPMATTPEPGTLILLGSGMVIAVVRKRRTLSNIVWKRS